MREGEIIGCHCTHVRTLDQLLGDKFSPLDSCYRNYFKNFASTDYLLIGLEADEENTVLFCEEFVDRQ